MREDPPDDGGIVQRGDQPQPAPAVRACLRDREARMAARWPLWQPVLVFSSVSLVSALASGHPVTALGVCKGLLLVTALYVTADALAGPAERPPVSLRAARRGDGRTDDVAPAPSARAGARGRQA